MGEATYYLKARFPEPISDELLAKINAFRQVGEDAYEYWQSDRDRSITDTFRHLSSTWPIIDRYFDVALPGYIITDKSSSNDFAGLLDFGRHEDNELFEIRTDDPCVLTFQAYVWHFADWDPLTEFLKSEFGAIAVNWVSDEYVDIGDLVQV